MQSLHGPSYHGAENGNGLECLVHAVAGSSMLDALLYDDHTPTSIAAILQEAHTRITAPPSTYGMDFDARALNPPPPTTDRLPTSPPPPPLINVDKKVELLANARQLELYANILRFVQTFIIEHTKLKLRRKNLSIQIQDEIWQDAKIGTNLAIPAILERELKRRKF